MLRICKLEARMKVLQWGAHGNPTAKTALSLIFLLLFIWSPQIAAIGMIRIIRSLTTLMTLAQTTTAYWLTQFSPFATLSALPTHSVMDCKDEGDRIEKVPIEDEPDARREVEISASFSKYAPYRRLFYNTPASNLLYSSFFLSRRLSASNEILLIGKLCGGLDPQR